MGIRRFRTLILGGKNKDFKKALKAIEAAGRRGEGVTVVSGDLVMEKHEVANVESGGIGIQIVYGGETGKANLPAPLAADTAHLTTAPSQCNADTATLPTAPSPCDADIVNLLKPIFFGIESEARQFLSDIRGMRPSQVTEKVNILVGERKISTLSKGRALWKVLYGCGLYDKSETNWNRQVK